MTETSRVQKLLVNQNAEIDRLKSRIEQLEAALLELSEDWGCCGITIAMRTIARKALEGKDD